MARIPASLAPLKSRVRRILMMWAFIVAVVAPLVSQTPARGSAILPEHGPGILPKATHLPRNSERSNDQVTFEAVSRVTDEGGFWSFSRELEDANSSNFHKPIAREEFTARFGRTQEAYEKVLDYLNKRRIHAGRRLERPPDPDRSRLPGVGRKGFQRVD
jgi:hypothetical protein